MSEEVVKYEGKAPAIVEISIEDIKKFIAPNATDKELFMFMGIAKSYGLNPMKREIHFIKYGSSPGQTVVGYETYLKRAEATGRLDGWECTTDGKKAFVTIYRKDRGKPFKWEVDRSEFDKGQSTWKAMPNFMLKKVAIAQAFRLCFPEELGGMPYMPEEINGATSEGLKGADDIPDFPPPKEGPKSIITPIVNVTKVKDKDEYKIFGLLNGNEQSFKTDKIEWAEAARKEKGSGLQFDIEYDEAFNVVSFKQHEPEGLPI